jgi:cardiolipin synthase
MFSRASGARLREGNRVRLLKDAAQNYPAWLDAIGAARHTIHFEMYIIHEDDQGRLFADALIEKARQGVRVRLLYDWMGGFGKTSRAFWKRLSAGGVEVRCYNPPRFDSPLGWVSRDHRKMISVDRTIAFVTGLCVGQMWVGDPGRHLDPWRDTGVEVRGPAVADIEHAFADAWAAAGRPLEDDTASAEASTALQHSAKDDRTDVAAMRVVATVPNTAGMFRVDQLVAALARKTLWLTDAYYAGTTPYVQSLRAAAADGVDGKGARVGSTNLNLASWLGNRELDVMIEEEPFVRRMEEMYLTDLANSTEVVLDARNRVRAPGAPSRPHKAAATSSGGMAAAGVMRIGSTVSAAVSNRRVLEPIEAHIALIAGAALAVLAFLAFTYPRGIAFPLATIAVWMAAALLFRGLSLLRARTRQHRERIGQPERVSLHTPPIQRKGPEPRI